MLMGHFSSNVDGDYEVYSINADGTGITRMTNDEVNETNVLWSNNL
jgi:hypothetical protein